MINFVFVGNYLGLTKNNNRPIINGMMECRPRQHQTVDGGDADANRQFFSSELSEIKTPDTSMKVEPIIDPAAEARRL